MVIVLILGTCSGCVYCLCAHERGKGLVHSRGCGLGCGHDMVKGFCDAGCTAVGAYAAVRAVRAKLTFGEWRYGVLCECGGG